MSGRRIAADVRGLGRTHLGRQRLLHSRRVAALAARLCRRHGLDPDWGWIAGLGHDLAREMEDSAVRALTDMDGIPYDADELSMPVLLHGRAAAVLLRRDAGVTEPQILDAVRCHVTGRPGMGVLAKILFAADYLEPGRGFLPQARRWLILRGDLDSMVRLVVRDTMTYLERRGRPVARAARALAAELG